MAASSSSSVARVDTWIADWPRTLSIREASLPKGAKTRTGKSPRDALVISVTTIPRCAANRWRHQGGGCSRQYTLEITQRRADPDGVRAKTQFANGALVAST